ncbi:hypothetical protein K2173_001782 [Erythroxylum novogranatense]|uniref:Uncharacterized protein n=1 Tax=Erythroxylum novogranatense TaxID=1862640 RepID=A0AAV8SIL2_9ROSI|nr:hypothetical protein K2173_001782 [Erythroxylum novogranatense]
MVALDGGFELVQKRRLLPHGSKLCGLNRAGNTVPVSSNLSTVSSGLPICRSSGSDIPAHVRGELNTVIIGLGDDRGYGGGWVPLVALKKVLRGCNCAEIMKKLCLELD